MASSATCLISTAFFFYFLSQSYPLRVPLHPPPRRSIVDKKNLISPFCEFGRFSHYRSEAALGEEKVRQFVNNQWMTGNGCTICAQWYTGGRSYSPIAFGMSRVPDFSPRAAEES
ncbi:hypothetical protein GGS26DRAFT_185640 [Hypomontagnella submonticulosa]|nr:hypothetical protein GGS26DRAFT_185640 [Hypomontagnella submonticulosa]